MNLTYHDDPLLGPDIQRFLASQANQKMGCFMLPLALFSYLHRHRTLLLPSRIANLDPGRSIEDSDIGHQILNYYSQKFLMTKLAWDKDRSRSVTDGDVLVFSKPGSPGHFTNSSVVGAYGILWQGSHTGRGVHIRPKCFLKNETAGFVIRHKLKENPWA